MKAMQINGYKINEMSNLYNPILWARQEIQKIVILCINFILSSHFICWCSSRGTHSVLYGLHVLLWCLWQLPCLVLLILRKDHLFIENREWIHSWTNYEFYFLKATVLLCFFILMLKFTFNLGHLIKV